MKKFWKSLMAVACAAAMAATVTGCNNESTSGSENSNADNTNSTDNTNSNNSTNSTDNTNSGVAGGTESGMLIIGGIGPITGNTAQYGINVMDGIQLAVDEINANGGVNGMKLKLNFQDDENDPEKSVNAYNTLKDKGMKMLIGTVTSKPCEAVSVEAAADNMFLFTPSGSSIECITAGDNCFRMCFTDPKQGQIAAEYIAGNMEAKKIGIIYDSTDSYSSGIVDGFEAAAADNGLEVVEKQAFSENRTDFSVQIQKIADSGADLLFLPFYYTEAALVIQQAQGKLDIPILGGDGLDGLIGAMGDNISAADGVYVMSPYASTSPDEKSKAFTEAFQAKFPDVEVNQFAADGYDCVYALKAAIEKAGVTDANISASDLCDKLKAAMVEIQLDGVTGTTKWTADGESEKAPKVLQIVVENGVGSYKVL